jgi:cleavage and polyadenylation specificity factor subunit 1
VLDGSFMTQELNFTAHSSESSSSSSEPLGVASASIADPYVLLKMVDGTIQLLVGGIVYPLLQHSLTSCFFAVVFQNLVKL